MKDVSGRKIIRILFRKEMKDIFRDRKSVLMMFFVPVVLYPLIFFVAFLILSMMRTGVSVQTYDIVTDSLPDTRLEQQLKEDQQEKNKNKTTYVLSFFNTDDFDAIVQAFEEAEGNNTSTDNKSAGDMTENKPAEDSLRDRVARALKDESIDAYVSYKDGEYLVYFNSSVTNSQATASLIETALSEVRQTMVKENLKEAGLDADEVLNPITLEEEDTATSEQSLGYVLGTIIPFMMIMALLVGVFTPAIDATTGEKERGTMETLLMMPVNNSQIIVAKFFSVALVGLITTLLSVASMAGLGVYMLTLVESMGSADFGGIDIGTFLPTILITLPVLIVLSLFLTAICMCVTCFAKSYKEANTYMSPVMILVMLTGYIGFIPNIDFDKTVAMIPVANVCLLIKNLLLFKVNIELILIVIASTAVYTGLVILLLGKMYRSEAILFDEGRNGLALLERRSNMKPGGVPSSGDGWFIAMVGFLLLMIAGGLLQAKLGLNGVAWTQVIILVLPVAMALYTRKDIRETFSLRLPSVPVRPWKREVSEQTVPSSPLAGLRAWAGGLLLGIGAISLGQAVTSIVYGLFPQEGEAVTDSLVSVLEGPGLWLWIVVAVMPAICEEALFRGYLMSAFRSRFKPWTSILFVAIVFGIYHTSPVRFPATALLGGAFAYTVYKTGSILPGAILHCMNNSIAVCVILFPEWMEAHLPFLMTDVQGTTVMLVEIGAGAVLILAGVLLMKSKNESAKEKELRA